jgi:hypothetical protein
VDRVEALGGTLQIRSPAGIGTELLIEIPVASPSVSGIPGASVTASRGENGAAVRAHR